MQRVCGVDRRRVEYGFARQSGVVAEVRATLLAALRSAVLWRQLGGSYWDLLLSRRAMVETAKSLLIAA